MRGVVEATGRPLEDIVEEFGVALVPGLLEVYGFLVNPRWSFMDFLVNTEETIHRGVKINTPNSRLPELQAERLGPDSVAITYRSKRALCPLAKRQHSRRRGPLQSRHHDLGGAVHAARRPGVCDHRLRGGYLGRQAQGLPHRDHRAGKVVHALDLIDAGARVVSRIVGRGDRP